MVIGGVDRKAYIQMMEKEALLSGPNETASESSYKTTVQYTDVTLVKQLWSKWESQGLYIFLLPNIVWQYIKKDELAETFV